MQPLDLSVRPPRSPFEELDGLIFMPRTIDKLRAQLPGGNLGVYFINGTRVKGMSAFLFEWLGISESDLLAVVASAEDESEIAAWIRSRTDPAKYERINGTIRSVKLAQTPDPAFLAEFYAEALAQHPELERIIDIIEADDRLEFPEFVR